MNIFYTHIAFPGKLITSPDSVELFQTFQGSKTLSLISRLSPDGRLAVSAPPAKSSGISWVFIDPWRKKPSNEHGNRIIGPKSLSSVNKCLAFCCAFWGWVFLGSCFGTMLIFAFLLGSSWGLCLVAHGQHKSHRSTHRKQNTQKTLTHLKISTVVKLNVLAELNGPWYNLVRAPQVEPLESFRGTT